MFFCPENWVVNVTGRLSTRLVPDKVTPEDATLIEHRLLPKVAEVPSVTGASQDSENVRIQGQGVGGPGEVQEAGTYAVTIGEAGVEPEPYLGQIGGAAAVGVLEREGLLQPATG